MVTQSTASASDTSDSSEPPIKPLAFTVVKPIDIGELPSTELSNGSNAVAAVAVAAAIATASGGETATLPNGATGIGVLTVLISKVTGKYTPIIFLANDRSGHS